MQTSTLLKADAGITLFQAMAQYQNPFVIAQFQEEIPEQADKAPAVFYGLMQYLCLSIISESRRAPSYLIDRMWHIFILDTKEYREFCSRFKGSYIDHNPRLDEISAKPFYESTIEAARRIFGEIDDHVWSDAVRCSS